jgi:hypothetical protein
MAGMEAAELLGAATARAAEQGGNHGHESPKGHTQVRQEGAEHGRICDASQETRNAEERPERPHGDQPEAGRRDRSVGGAEERREGSATPPRIEPLSISAVKDRHPVHEIQPCGRRHPPCGLFFGGLTLRAAGTRPAVTCMARHATPEEGPEMDRRNESGRIGYLVLYMMGVPIGILLLLWVLLGNNIFGPG